jgi:hypothetical protein
MTPWHVGVGQQLLQFFGSLGHSSDFAAPSAHPVAATAALL